MTLDSFAALLSRAKAHRIKGCRGYRALCPAHDDSTPSFAVWEGADGWLHVNCQRGCSEQEILAALGLKSEDRRIEEPIMSMIRGSETFYTYTDENGSYLFEKVRAIKDGKKEFIQRIRLEGGKFNYRITESLNGKSKTLYRIGEVIAGIKGGRRIWIHEGEKAVEAFRQIGEVATCQPAGAGKEGEKCKWLLEHSVMLRGADVGIIADRDAVGEGYAREVARLLRGYARRIQVFQSATTNDKDDGYDHVLAGHSVDELVRRQDLEPEIGFSAKPLESYAYERPTFLWDPYIRLRHLNLLDAKGGAGKSRMVIMIAAAGSNGKTPFGEDIEPYRTLYFGNEDQPGEYRELYESLGGQPGFFFPVTEVFRLDAEGLTRVEEQIMDLNCKMVCFDAITYYLAGLVRNPWDGMEIAPILNQLHEVMWRTYAAALDIRHFAKATLGKGPEDLGAGAEQWRNSHRSQLVLRPHPDKDHHRGHGIIVHAKSGMTVEPGPPFGIAPIAGTWGFTRDVDLSVFNEEQRRPGPKSDCVPWLRALIEQGTHAVADIRKLGEEQGKTAPAIYRAKDSLQLVETTQFGRKVWHFDPFSDPGTAIHDHVYRGGE